MPETGMPTTPEDASCSRSRELLLEYVTHQRTCPNRHDSLLLQSTHGRGRPPRSVAGSGDTEVQARFRPADCFGTFYRYRDQEQMSLHRMVMEPAPPGY